MGLLPTRMSSHDLFSCTLFLKGGEGELELPYLLVGLSDGMLVIYDLDPTLNAMGRRLVHLGTVPSWLTPYRHGNKGGSKSLGSASDVIFVSGNRLAVLFVNNEQVQHLPIVLKVYFHSLTSSKSMQY